MSQNSATSDTRFRNWAFILYPESAPENWAEILSDEKMKILVSPVHDADKNADGEEKKSHRHVLLVFDGKKSEKQAQVISDKVCGVKVQAVNSLRSYARYLCHLDNPEKAQYSVSGVLSFGGIDYQEIVQSAADTELTLTSIENFIDEQGIVSYPALCRYARAKRPEWTRIIRTHTFHLRAYVQGCQWEQENGLHPCPWECSSDEEEPDEE